MFKNNMPERPKTNNEIFKTIGEKRIHIEQSKTLENDWSCPETPRI